MFKWIRDFLDYRRIAKDARANNPGMEVMNRRFHWHACKRGEGAWYVGFVKRAEAIATVTRGGGHSVIGIDDRNHYIFYKGSGED